MISIGLKAFDSGYCTINEKLILPNKKGRTIKLPALFYLLQHPDKGNILFDAGYSSRFFSETKRFPFRIHRKMTPVNRSSLRSAVEHLGELGISTSEINYIFISHFHADHICGLSDFPKATFICSKKGYEDIKDKKGFKALRKSVIPNLIPNDFENRVIFIEDQQIFTGKQSNYSDEVIQFTTIYSTVYDVFGDQSCLSVDLSGHAAGQFGLFLKSDFIYYFLIADACYKSDAYRSSIMPHKLANIIMDNVGEYKNTLHTIIQIHRLQSNICILPSHCEQSLVEVNERNE